jgi:hypothetical protein
MAQHDVMIFDASGGIKSLLSASKHISASAFLTTIAFFHLHQSPTHVFVIAKSSQSPLLIMAYALRKYTHSNYSKLQ